MQPKVSMVIPCYNKVKWIGEMLNSVIAQQWDNIEVILVNDGSTDGTRDVISGYEPKLKARGYEVFIINQENKGVAAAVCSGLKYITGEFVCMPDCDDILHPEYVSEMAGYLAEHQEVMWTMCDCDDTPYDFESHTALKKDVTIGGVEQYPYKLLESILAKRLSTRVCNKIYRSSYLAKCGVIENFAVEPRATQEPQVVLPIILGGEKPTIFRRVLYYYPRRNGSIMHNAASTAENALEWLEKYNRLIDDTLRSRGVYNDYIDSLLRYGYMCTKYTKLRHFNISEDDYIRELVYVINQSGLAQKSIDETVALQAGAILTHRWFSNMIIGYPQNRVRISRKAGGRLIAYSAFGKAVSAIRSGLLGSDIRPDVFWDIAAKPGDQINEIPVTKPNFENLAANDIVLVLIRDPAIAQRVIESLEKTPAIENTWYYYDALDHLADFYFHRERNEHDAG